MKDPIFFKFEKLNRKWAFKILFTVFEYDRAGFNKIKRSLSPITSKILSNRLKALEEISLVRKSVVADRPVKVEYHLTRRGKRIVSALAKSLGA